MIPKTTLDSAIRTAWRIIGTKDTPEAWVMTYVIGLQESRFEVRRQYNDGPAVGFWQFERGGGIAGVLSHPASKAKAIQLCIACKVEPTARAVWDALQRDDVLGAGFCRLLLLTDPHALPTVGDVEGAWQYYLRNWRPGAYTRGNEPQRAALRRKWANYYDEAKAAL